MVPTVTVNCRRQRRHFEDAGADGTAGADPGGQAVGIARAAVRAAGAVGPANALEESTGGFFAGQVLSHL